MRIAGVLLAGVVVSGLAAPASAQPAKIDLVKWEHFDGWLDAILHHTAGRNDAAVQTMLGMRAHELEAVFPHMVASLRTAFRLQERPFTADQFFGRYGTLGNSPAEVKALRVRVDRILATDIPWFLKRAAMLHADLAVASPGSHLTLRAGSGHLVNDGRGVADEGRPWHWIVGRAFLHLVPRAREDPDVLLWYQAAGNHLWSLGNFTEAVPHTKAAIEIFSRDAEIQFLHGLVHEAHGAPHLQAAVADQIASMTPRARASFRSDVLSAARENATARDAFQKAIAEDPGHVEARIRLGRLLSLDGKHERAAVELREALLQTEDTRLRYFAQLFLGRAEESLEHIDEARAAYEAAAALFPEAQSPRLALSQLALQAGEREAAGELFALLAEPSRDDADPWWTYHRERVPRATVWLLRLVTVFREGGK